jgi:hypothetical protein
MNMDDLLYRYFEGETSSEEERRLRAYFASDDVPQRFAVYKPIFACFEEESRKKQPAPPAKPLFTLRKALLTVSGVAAGLLLLMGIRQAFFNPEPCLCSAGYVVINGHCYTDADKIRSVAFEALQEVATPAGNYFLEMDNPASGLEIMENQLKELDSLFSGDE